MLGSRLQAFTSGALQSIDASVLFIAAFLVLGLPVIAVLQRYAEVIENAIEHLAQPRQLIRTVTFSAFALFTLPVRWLWIAAIDPFLQFSGRLKETINPGLTQSEMTLRMLTIVAILLSGAVLGRGAYDYYRRDDDRRPPLNFAVWRPDDCEKRMRGAMREEYAMGRSKTTIRVVMRDQYERVSAFCNTKWDSAALNKMSALVTPIREAIELGTPRELNFLGEDQKSRSEVVDKFLIENGAADLVQFMKLRSVLPIIYEAYINKPGWQDGLQLNASEKIQSLHSSLPWNMVISKNAQLGSLVELHQENARPIEFIRKNSSPVTLIELAAWLHFLEKREARLSPPPIHPETRSDLERIGDRVRAVRTAKRSSETTPRRSFQVVLAKDPKPTPCKLAVLVVPGVHLCPKDDRLLIEQPDSALVATAPANSRPPLIPESVADTVIGVLADHP